MSTKSNRIIITNIKDFEINGSLIYNYLLHHTSVQLSDGYWEGQEDQWGHGWHEEFWEWLEFEATKDDYLIIKVKGKPIWSAKNIFSKMSDEEVIHYVGKVLNDCYEDCSSVYYNVLKLDHTLMDSLITDCIKNLLTYKANDVIVKLELIKSEIEGLKIKNVTDFKKAVIDLLDKNIKDEKDFILEDIYEDYESVDKTFEKDEIEQEN